MILLVTSNAQVFENIVAAFASKFVDWHGVVHLFIFIADQD